MSLDGAILGLLKRIDRLEGALERQYAERGSTVTTTGITGTSTTSASVVDMAGATSTLVTSTTNVLVVLDFTAATVTPAAFTNWQLHLDGVNQANFVFDDMTTARRSIAYTQVFASLARGSHTIKVRWSVAGGATVAHAGGVMWIIEL
jgi:hypothetical protein